MVNRVQEGVAGDSADITGRIKQWSQISAKYFPHCIRTESQNILAKSTVLQDNGFIIIDDHREIPLTDERGKKAPNSDTHINQCN